MATYVLLCFVLTLVVATIQSRDFSSQELDSLSIPFFENKYLKNEASIHVFPDVRPVPPRPPPVMMVLYETMGPESKELFKHLSQVHAALPHVYIFHLAYGNTVMTTHLNGTITFVCPHGEAECYANKLHTCVNYFSHRSRFSSLDNVQYNNCLMELGSNDDAVNKCGNKFNVAVPITSFIKSCAKDYMGNKLLKRAGDSSVYIATHYHIPSNMSLPYVFINSEIWQGKYEDLLKDVCAAFDASFRPKVCDDMV